MGIGKARLHPSYAISLSCNPLLHLPRRGGEKRGGFGETLEHSSAETNASRRIVSVLLDVPFGQIATPDARRCFADAEIDADGDF